MPIGFYQDTGRDMSRRSLLKLVTRPQDYFRELITGAVRNQNVELSPEAEVYLVNLLNGFLTTDRLFAVDAKGQKNDRPLVVQIKEAFEETTREAQRLMFRQVGDSSLYLSGFFQESLRQKLVDVDYYIDMGGIAYSQVASIEGGKNLKKMYGELSGKFSSFVNILAEVSESTTPNQTAKDLYQLYETYLETGSQRAENALKKAGICPVRSHSKIRN